MTLKIRIVSNRNSAVRIPFIKGQPGVASGTTRSFDILDVLSKDMFTLSRDIATFAKNGLKVYVETDLPVWDKNTAQAEAEKTPEKSVEVPARGSDRVISHGVPETIRGPLLDVSPEPTEGLSRSVAGGGSAYAARTVVLDVDGERARNLSKSATPSMTDAIAAEAAMTEAQASPPPAEATPVAPRRRRSRKQE